jgi:hypothetical protein
MLKILFFNYLKTEIMEILTVKKLPFLVLLATLGIIFLLACQKEELRVNQSKTGDDPVVLRDECDPCNGLGCAVAVGFNFIMILTTPHPCIYAVQQTGLVHAPEARRIVMQHRMVEGNLSH